MPARVGSEVAEHPVDRVHVDTDASAQSISRCRQCRAAVSGPTRSSSCPFCDGALAPRQDNGALMMPDGVLPLLLSREQAQAELETEFERLGIDERPLTFNAVFSPWWMLSWDVAATYEGQRGIEHTQQGPGGTYRTHIVWEPWCGRMERPWSDILRPGSLGVSTGVAARLSPWDFAFIEPYDPAKVAGQWCEHTVISGREVMNHHRAEVAAEVRTAIEGDMGGDHQILDKVDIVPSNERYRLLLMPMWVGRLATGVVVAVNARTGEVVVQGQAARQVNEDDILEVPSDDLRGVAIGAAVVVLVLGLLYWLAG